MKNLLFLLVLIPCAIFAQSTEYGNFKIIDSEIVYQKVFAQDSVSTAKLVDFLKSVPNVSNVQVFGEVIQADLVDFTVDYKKFQFTQNATPTLIQTGRYSGKIKVDGKAGKYRVTMRTIQVKGDAGYKKIPNPENLTNYACVNSATSLNRDWCKPNTLGLLDKAITDRFTFKEGDGTEW
jgi:hypothetical protein